MAKSSAGKRWQNRKSNIKHKSYSKLSMDENILAFVNIGHSLKPCSVSLTRIDADTYLANVKHNSHVLKQRVGISFTVNDEIHSKGLKKNCINLDKFQKTTGVPKKSLHSKGSVKNIHNSSASCSFVTVHDDTVIKPCYIKLERLNTAVKRHCLDFSGKISSIKKIKLCESNTCKNFENISSSPKYLTHEEHLSQPGDADVACISNVSEEGSSDMKFLKPCSVQVRKLIGTESVSNMNHTVFSPGSCKLNKLVDAEDSMTGSFISDSLLSTPSSLGDYEINKKTEELDALILPSNSLKSNANKKMRVTNDGPSPLSKPTHITKLFSDSSSSGFDVNIEVRISDDNENSVERSVRLLPSAACSSLKFDAEKTFIETDDDVLKCSTKQKAKLIPSCSSSECSTVRNNAKYSTKNHRSAFSQRKNRRNNPSKRNLSHLPSYDSSSDSSSTVVNCRIATFNSSKQGLMKRNAKSLGTASVINSRTTINGNVIDKIKPVSCKQGRKSLDRTNIKIGESSARKCETSCSSETEENFSDNYFHKLNNDAYAGNLRLKQSKHSSKRRKHFVVNGTHSSSEDKCEVQLISSDKGTVCNLSENKSNNADTERKCKVSPNYNLKPCYVTLNRVEKIDSATKIFREKSSNLQEDDPLKPVSQVECVELNCSKQSKSFESTNTSEIYKSMNNSQRDRSFGENNDSVSVEECRVLTDSESEKDCVEPCTDYATNRNSVDQLQDDYATNKNSVDQLQDSSDESGRQESSCKQFSKPIYYFSDDSDSLPDVDTIIANSQHLKKSICRKVSSESNDLTTENHYRILNSYEAGVVTEDNDRNLVATDIDNVSNRSRSPVKSENNFAGRENVYDPDDAYLADTDDYSDSDFVKNHNSNHISQGNDETSVGLRVNLPGSKNEDKSIPTNPYCSLGSKIVDGKHFDSIHFFKSKTNGSMYIVDIFEFERIVKMFVTIKLKGKANLHGNTLFEKRNLPTLSERMNALGCFDEENARIYHRNPFTLTNIDRSEHESEVHYLEKQNPSPGSTSHLVGKDTVFSAFGNCSKSSGDACTEPKLSCSQSSEFKDLTVSSTSSDSSDSADDTIFNNHCVHCCEKFSNKKEEFNHTCEGKLQKGFLCIYCEKIFSSYSKLRSHKQLHFI